MNSGYLGTINITNSTESTVWTFRLLNATEGVEYVLYYPTADSIINSTTGSDDTTLTATGITDGTYYIIQYAPNVEITSFDPSNVTCKAEIALSKSTTITPITVTLRSVVNGRSYVLYDPATDHVYGQAVASNDTAVISMDGLVNGVYWIAETGAEIIEITYWNPNNVSCNGILDIRNTTQFDNNISIKLNNVTSGAVYKLYRLDLRQVYGSGSVVNGSAYINVTGLLPGEYRIAETGLERIHITSWTPTNATCKGIIEIQNSTPITTWTISVLNTTIGALSFYSPSLDQTLASPYMGLVDGIYWLTGSHPGFIDVPAVVTTTIVSTVIIASVIGYWYRRRRS